MSLEPRAATARRITVAIVADDDHEGLAATLATARAVGDEILIVDSGTSKKPTELARAAQAVVIKQPWKQDYSALRNAALERATGDWIFWLEPGESMASDDAARLRQFALGAADPRNVYLLVVTVPPVPGDISGEQVAQMRLVPRDHRLSYRGRVRDELHPTPESVGLGREGVAWRISRLARPEDPQLKQSRLERRLELIDLDLAERGPIAPLLNARGEALIGLGDLADAAKAFRQSVAVAPPASTAQREAYYGLLTSYIDPAERAMQVRVCVEALEKFPFDAQLLAAMGGYMQAEGRLDLSAQAYRTAAEVGHIDPQAWHVPDIHEIAAICLSLTFQLRSEESEARTVLEQFLTRRPEANRVRRYLIELHVRSDRRAEALAEFDRLPAETPHREALRSAIRGACLAAKRNWVPAAAYLQTAYAAGCRDLVCLRWLALVLVSTGQNEAAQPILREWQTLEPRSPEPQKYLDALAGAHPADAAPVRTTPAPHGQTTGGARRQAAHGHDPALGPILVVPQTAGGSSLSTPGGPG